MLQPPIRAEILHNLQKWSDDEVIRKRRVPERKINQQSPAIDNSQQPNAGVKTRQALALEKEKLNLRYKGIQQQIELNN